MPPSIHRLLLRAFGRLPPGVRRRLVRWGSPSFTVGALCVVEDDGRILLVRHRYRVRWGLPGGLLGRGEHPGDGVRREVREEVGLDVELSGDPVVVVDPHRQLVDIVFRGVVGDGAGVRPTSPEIVDARWFEVETLPDMQEEAVEAIRTVLRGSATTTIVDRDRRSGGRG